MLVLTRDGPSGVSREVLVEEQSRLLPLPEPLPCTDLVQPVAADKTALVRFDTNRYSVPPACANKTLTLVASDMGVRILDGELEVARHPRSWAKAQLLEALEHRTELLQQKKAAREAKGRDVLTAAIPGFPLLLERWVEAGRNVGFMTARTLHLLDLYGADVLRAAAREALARGSHDPARSPCSARSTAAPPVAPIPIDIALGAHVPDRDVIPHDLESYDAQRRSR